MKRKQNVYSKYLLIFLLNSSNCWVYKQEINKREYESVILRKNNTGITGGFKNFTIKKYYMKALCSFTV